MGEIKLVDFSRFKTSIRSLIEVDPYLEKKLNDKEICEVKISFSESDGIGNENITHKLHITFDQYCFDKVDPFIPPDSGYYELSKIKIIGVGLVEKKMKTKID